MNLGYFLHDFTNINLRLCKAFVGSHKSIPCGAQCHLFPRHFCKVHCKKQDGKLQDSSYCTLSLTRADSDCVDPLTTFSRGAAPKTLNTGFGLEGETHSTMACWPTLVVYSSSVARSFL